MTGWQILEKLFLVAFIGVHVLLALYTFRRKARARRIQSRRSKRVAATSSED